MIWLKTNTAKGQGARTREILAINSGLIFQHARWKYVGYKGGSETGVLNLTWLLQHRDGQWYALSAGWNNDRAGLDEETFFGLLQNLIILLEK